MLSDRPTESNRSSDSASRVSSWLLNLVASEEELSRAPQRDRNDARTYAVLLVALWAFFVTVMSAFLVRLLGSSALDYAGAFVGASIAATLLAGFDVLLVRASWVPAGMRALRQFANLNGGGANEPGGNEQWLEAMSNTFRVLLRVGVSVFGASVYALVLVLLIAKSSVVEEQENIYKHANQEHYRSESRLFDARVDNNAKALDAEKKDLAALQEETRTQRAVVDGKTRDNTSADTEAARLQANIAQTLSSINNIESDIVKYGHLIACELAGEKTERDCDGASGVAGPKQRYQAYLQHKQTSVDQLNLLKSQLDEYQEKLQGLQNASTTRLAQLDQEEAASREHIRILEKKADDLNTRRSAEIDEKVKNTVPPPTGPMAEIRALYSLAHHDRATAILWFHIDAFVTLLELSVVFAALSIDTKGSFPVRMAVNHTKDVIAGAAEIIDEVKSRRRSDNDASESPIDLPDPPLPPAPAAVKSEEPLELAERERTGRNPAADATTSKQVESLSGVSIPFMITKAMKQRLRARGFSNDEIALMSPADAHAVLR